MHGTNYCAGLPVVHIDARPESMYDMQLKLQHIVGNVPDPTQAPKLAAKNVIYWTHCVFAELDELEEWVYKMTDPTWLAEAQMEAIDILHFVFNIGLELNRTTAEIGDIFADAQCTVYSMSPIGQICKHAKAVQRAALCVVNSMPWKTWKKYTVTSLSACEPGLSNEYRSLLLYVIHLCNSLGMSMQDIINVYYAKNAENIRRQRDGY